MGEDTRPIRQDTWRRSLWQKVLAQQKLQASAGLSVQQAQDMIKGINTLLEIEESPDLEAEDCPIAKQMSSLQQLPVLMGELKAAHSVAGAERVAQELISCLEKLHGWVDTVVCPDFSTALDEVTQLADAHLEGLDDSKALTECAEEFSNIAPAPLPDLASLMDKAFQLKCGLAPFGTCFERR